MPLVFAPLDQELTIVKVKLDEKTKAHLRTLGVIENGKIVVLSSNAGNIICVVKGVRLALNKDTASKIFIA